MSKVYVLAVATALLSLAACNQPAEQTPPPPVPEAAPAAAKPAEPAAAPIAQAAEKPAAPAAKPAAEAKSKSPATETKPAADASPAVEAKPAPPAELAKPAVPAAAAVPLSKDQAMVLAAKGNCVTCHKIEVRVVGPAWKDVAAKYRNDPNAAATIASHIKSGGSFGWKFGVMPPRGGSQLPDADVDSLAKFIAGLK